MKKISLFFATLLIFVSLCVTAIAAENVVYVNGTKSASGDGTTAATAFKTMNEGINAVASTHARQILLPKT